MRDIVKRMEFDVARLGLHGALVVVGVSGGPDSVALWHLLRQVQGLRLHLCHIDHGWRPREAVREQEICLDLARAAEAGASVIHLAPPQSRSEEEAREGRLKALRHVAWSLGAGAVALAHQQDDQAETVLMQLVRGSARATGMASWRAPFWRPLLGVPRAALRAVCEQAGLAYSIDSTNASDEFLRSRLRNQVMPLLRRENPRVDAAFGRYARLRQEDEQELLEAATATLATLPRLPGGIDLRGVPDLPRPLARRILWALAQERHVTLPADRLEEALGRLASGGRHEIGAGLRIEAGALWWGVARPDAVALPQGGRVRFGEYWAGFGAPPEDALTVRVGAGTLVLRGRLAGDRLRTARGTRKLQDIFVDEKVARPLRDLVPVLVLDGRPVWLPGSSHGPDGGTRSVWLWPSSVVSALWSVLK